MPSTTTPLVIRSGSVALVDPALLPEDVVEALAFAQAIVVMEAANGQASVHLDEEGGLVGIDRPASPRPSLRVAGEDVDLACRRDKVRAALSGAIVGAAVVAPRALLGA